MAARKKLIDNEFNLVIVGAGANGTYSMERLAAELSANPPELAMTIHVIEKSGHFGAGWVHSPCQPESSMLNRIVGQITFACDETNDLATNLLDKALRPTFQEWCKIKYKETNEEKFNLKPEDWPQRYIHGIALVEMFNKYKNILETIPNVSVHLHKAEVIDVEEKNGEFYVKCDHNNILPIKADHILFMTGHPTNKARTGSYEEKMTIFANHSQFHYSPFAYPLEQHVAEQISSKDHVVGCVGLGLTAIDVFLYLSEGRGGKFVKDDNSHRYTYYPSGKEPKKIIGFSRSGVFTTARAFNDKQVDLIKYEHKGVYLTEENIDILRKSVGIPVKTKDHKPINQLDFENHVFPVVYLEMVCLYYKTLYGKKFFTSIFQKLKRPFSNFIGQKSHLHDNKSLGIAELMSHVDPMILIATEIIEKLLEGEKIKNLLKPDISFDVKDMVYHYLITLFSDEQNEEIKNLILEESDLALQTWLNNRESPFNHPKEPKKHQFNWEKMINPIDESEYKTPKQYTQALLKYMDYDHLQAIQGNIKNPVKACCDGVWRDLRQVFAHAADFGGFTADSHYIFNKKYMRYHNRLANGTCIEIMEKMSALIRAGILDISIGPAPVMQVNEQDDTISISNPHTNTNIKINSLIDAKLHELNIKLDDTPLYQNLLKRGLINSWQYPATSDQNYIPGGIELTKEFHPIDGNGHCNRNFTFLGPTSEGVMFFQVGAARPCQNHHVLNDVIEWSNELFSQINFKYQQLNNSQLNKVS